MMDFQTDTVGWSNWSMLMSPYALLACALRVRQVPDMECGSRPGIGRSINGIRGTRFASFSDLHEPDGG